MVRPVNGELDLQRREGPQMELSLRPWFVCPVCLKLRRWVAVVLRATVISALARRQAPAP